jgi:hypothetical protein
LEESWKRVGRELEESGRIATRAEESLKRAGIEI